MVGANNMKITKMGLIMTLKNLGSWLTSYTLAGIKADVSNFLFMLLIYCLINVPSDLFLLNHYSDKIKKEMMKK
jgi:hypothetical protein